MQRLSESQWPGAQEAGGEQTTGPETGGKLLSFTLQRLLFCFTGYVCLQ